MVLYAQRPVSIHLSEKEGLPDVEFYDVMEDKDGFIWLAADKGLFRYDGKKFVRYTHPKQRGMSVFHLRKDAKGRIWCNNLTGQFFYLENNELQLFVDIEDQTNTLLPRYIITEQGLQIVTGRGYYKVDFATQEVKQFKKYPNANGIGIITEQKKEGEHKTFFMLDHIYVEDSTGIKKVYDLQIGRMPFLFTLDGEVYIVSKYIQEGLHQDDTRVYKYNETQQRFVQDPLTKLFSDKRVIDVIEIDNNVWFCTYKGVMLFKKTSKGLQYQKTLLESNFISKVMKDSKENYWFSTLNSGFYIIPNLHILAYQLPLNLKKIMSLIKVNDQLVFGTGKGRMGVLNVTNEELHSFQLKNSRVCYMDYSEKYHNIFVSQDFGSFIWDINNNNIEQSRFYSSAKKISIIKDTVLVYSGGVSTSLTYNQLKNYKKVTKRNNIKIPKVDRSMASLRDFNGRILRIKRAYTHQYTKAGELYNGYRDGLFYGFDFSPKKEIRYEGEPIYTNSMDETTDEILWVSTFNKGILGIKDLKVVKTYTEKDGLLSDHGSMIKADGNDLVVATEKGLQIIDRATQKIKTISLKDELNMLKVSGIAIDDTYIYLSGNNGIIKVDKKKAFKNLPKPKVYFSKILIKEKEMEIKDAYTLDYKTNGINIYFNTNGFKSEEKVQYKYRLKGLEKKWSETKNGIARYPIIPYGNFTFEVKTISPDHQEGIVKTLILNVKRPFWLQWWFYVLIAFTVILYLYVKYKQLKKRQRELLEKERVNKELILSQIENLRSQMNPHFVFNALNSIQEYIFLNEKYNATNYLSKFAKLIRIYLSHSKKNEISLSEELKALEIYLALEQDRFGEELEVELKVAKEVNAHQIFVPSLFIQPYIENVFKHGLFHKKGAKQLTIRFYKEATYLYCLIRDNGIGREASAKINQRKAKYYQSFSTKANKNRIELLNASREDKIIVSIKDLYDQEQHSLGTEVHIKIPLKNESTSN